MRSLRLALASSVWLGVPSVCLAQTAYVASTWSDNSVHLLDSGMGDLGSFATGSSLPNGVTSDGTLIWSAHFTTQEVIAYDMAGVQQFSWPATSGLQGLAYVSPTEICTFHNGVVDFYDPMTGAFVRSIPGAEGGTIEGLAFDGNSLWQLGSNGLYETDVNTGAILNTFTNAAGVCSFGGTGIADAGPKELMLACTSGDWFLVSKADGSTNASGNNGLDMYGLGAATGGGPPPCPDLVFCDTNNTADASIDTCDCGAGSINLTLSNAPAMQFSMLMVGAGNGVTNPPGSQGDLCLNGATIGSYRQDVAATDAAGSRSLDVLNAVSGGGGGGIPTIGGNLCTPANQTWNFQWWFRDGPANPSGFSKAIQVTFQ